MFDLEEELAALRDQLEDAAVEYAICGGIALGIHGHPRATIDIDILIQREDENRDREIARLRQFTIQALPMNFLNDAVQIRIPSKIDPLDGETLMLDLLLVTPPILSVWASRERLAWRGRTLTVVSRAGLIALKMMRSSKQDLADIARLRGEE